MSDRPEVRTAAWPIAAIDAAGLAAGSPGDWAGFPSGTPGEGPESCLATSPFRLPVSWSGHSWGMPRRCPSTSSVRWSASSTRWPAGSSHRSSRSRASAPKRIVWPGCRGCGSVRESMVRVLSRLRRATRRRALRARSSTCTAVGTSARHLGCTHSSWPTWPGSRSAKPSSQITDWLRSFPSPPRPRTSSRSWGI